MQRYYSTVNIGSSIPEDDGRSLLALDQYRLEVNLTHRYTVLEEYNLVLRARRGDKEASALLIESCQKYVYGVACHYSSLHPSNSDILDLVQVGNEAIVNNFEESLKSRYTTSFLCVVARRAIVTYCIEDKLIRVPYASYRRGCRAPLTVSLLAPLHGDTDRTLLDILECADWQAVGSAFEGVCCG